MKTLGSPSLTHLFVVYSLAVFTSFQAVPSHASPVGQIVGELIVRIFKNSDEAIKKTKDAAHSASTPIARKSVSEYMPTTDKQDWEACTVAAEKQSGANRWLALEELKAVTFSSEQLSAATKALNIELAKQFCLESIQCNVEFLPEYSTMVDDFANCIADETGNG